MTTRMRVLVTGGAGFIGSHVVDRLVDAGHEVTVADLAPQRRHDVAYVALDVLDLDAVKAAFQGIEVVFHLAAVADVNIAAADPVGAVALTVTGTTNVWEAARSAGVRRVVLASTVWVYGASRDEAPLTEQATFALADVNHIYTATKLACEMIAHSYHRLFGQEFTILRYGIPFGPRMRPALAIPRFVSQALANEPITLHGDGSQSRNYVYVGDLADAHVRALSDAGANQVFNLEGAEPVTLRQIVELLPELLGREVDVSYIPARAGDYDGRVVSAEHAAAVIGWRPSTSFRDGLNAYIEWHICEQATGQPVAADTVSQVSTSVVDEARSEPARPSRRPRASHVRGGAPALVVAAVGAGMPIGSIGWTGSTATRVAWVCAASLLALAAWVAGARSGRTRARAFFGLALVAVGVWLLPQWTPRPVGLALAIATGFGIALAAGSPGVARLLAFASGATVGVLFPHMAVPWVLVVPAALAAGMLLRSAPSGSSGRVPRVVDVLVAIGVALGVCWVGTVSMAAAWFAPFDTWTHSSGHNVALTFDGGPNDTATLEIASMLHDRGIGAAFFVDGRAAAQRPDVVAALGLEGHLVANNAIRQRSLIGSTLSGIDQTSRTIANFTGACPQFFRPPDGRKNPLLSWQVHRRGMAMVLGDVSPNDASEVNADRLAQSVLSRVRGGSIIVLHDGRNADPSVDRAVLVAAVPKILAGLDARGLHAVRLDVLLGRSPTPHGCLSASD